MKYLTIIFLMMILISCSDETFQLKEGFKDERKLLSIEDSQLLSSLGKSFQQVSEKDRIASQFSRIENKAYELISQDPYRKGHRFSALNIKEELKYFSDQSNRKEIVDGSSDLIKKIDGFLKGEKYSGNWKPINKDDTYKNDFALSPYLGPMTISSMLKDKMSFSYQMKSLFKEETEVYECEGITVSDPDPTADSLSASDFLTRRTEEIIELANEFDSLEELYKYVRDQVRPWPAFGATQSAKQVLETRVGTFIDKATLLITLLRAKGIAAQYILGDVLVEEEKLKGIFGVEGKYDLFWALTSPLSNYWNNISMKGPIYYKDGIRTWLIPHAWVRAYIDDEWQILDPSNIYYDYGTQNPIFRRFDPNIDFEAYLLGQNARGQYEKPGTIIDFLLESIGEQVRNTFGNGVSLRNLDLTRFGRPITADVNGLPLGTMAYDEGGCALYQEDTLPTDFIQKYSLTLKKNDTVLFEGEWDLPEITEKGLSTRHDAGLVSRVGEQAGNMKVFLGDDEVGSIVANTTDSIAMEYYLEYYPSAYGEYRELGDSDTSISSAGDIYTFMAYNAPTSKQNLTDEISKLKDMIAVQSDEGVLYTQFLRVANILTVLQEYEQSNLSHIINTTGGDLRGTFYTYGIGGIVKDREDRPYGAIPLGTGISWQTGARRYSKTGNFTTYTDYTNITDLRLMGIIYGSQIEANIWEILYGVPGGSTTKILQLLAKDIYEEGADDTIVGNQQLGVGRDAEILAMFDDTMIGNINYRVNDIEQGYVKYKSILYSHRSEYVKENGYTGKVVLILPTDPRAGTVASYSGNAPSPAFSPKGGGSTGSETDAQSSPDSIDINDPDISGASYSCNPVSYSTGDMFHEFSDFLVKGRTIGSSLKFERKYSTSIYKPLGDLGPSWTHNYQTRIVTEGHDSYQDSIEGNLVWIKEGGNKVIFTRSIDGNYSAPSGVRDTLEVLDDTIVVIRKGGDRYVYSRFLSNIPAGRLSYFEEVHGERVTAVYDENERLSSVEAPFAGSVEFNYDDEGRIISIYRVRDDLTYTFEYDDSGYLNSSADFQGNTTTYSYVTDREGTNAQGLLNSIVDPLGNEISFEYYDDGRVFQEVGKGGATTTYFYSYFSVDHMTRTIGANGTTKIFKFDDDFRLIETEYEDGSRVKQVWDDDSNLIRSIDELGYETSYIYDDRGNKIGVKAPEYSDYIITDYDPTFDKPTLIAPLVGAYTVNTYDEQTGDLLLTEKQDSDGSVYLEFIRDSFGNIVTTTNNEASYSNERDSNGFLTKQYDLRNPISIEYDSRGRVAKRTFNSGRTLTMAYDDFDQITRIDDSSGPSILYEYDVLGRKISQSVSDGTTVKMTSYEYDARNRLVATVDPLGRRTEREYDLPGLGCRLIVDSPRSVIDPVGRKTKYEYDSRNRLVRTVDPDGTVTRREYNERGDLIAITDGNGNRSTFSYDGNRRLIKKTRPSARSVTGGKVQAAKEITYYEYDEADRLIREEMLLAGIQNGTETAKLVTQYTYNELGQQINKILKKEFQGDEEILDESSYSYRRLLDAPAQLTANNESVHLSFSYENQPPFALTHYQVESSNSENSLGMIEGIYAITRDVTGNVKTLTKSGVTNPIFENDYDQAGRLVKKTSRYNGHRLISEQSYDGFGRKNSLSHDSGLTGSWGYDILDRLTSLSYSSDSLNISENLTYEEDSGNITAIERELGSLELSYDDKDQLTSVAYSGDQGFSSLFDRTLEYDSSGNRIQDTFTGTGDFTRNTITEDDNYRYYSDANGFGNIVQRTNKQTSEQHIFEYWNDGRLRKFTKYEQVPNTTKTLEVEYYYDALGRRVAKKVKGRSSEFTQTYSYDGTEDKILFAKSGDDKVQLQIDGQGIDEHWAQITKSGVSAFSSDHLGTVLNSEVSDAYHIVGTFGETLQTAPSMNITANPVIYGFTGRQFDSETGLYYYRNRVYDPSSGRFMTKDPLGIQGGDVNLYRYANNNPTLYNDPFGLFVGPGISPEMFATYASTSEGQSAISQNLGKDIPSDVRYVQVGDEVIDARHAAAAFQTTQSLIDSGVNSTLAGAATYTLGLGVETLQYTGFIGQSGSSGSGFSSEDIPSNSFGIGAAQAGYSNISEGFSCQ